MSSGRSKLKQRDTITHLLEWPKSRRLTTSDAGEDVKQLEISYTIGRHAKLNILSWYDPIIVLLGLYAKELKTCLYI